MCIHDKCSITGTLFIEWSAGQKEVDQAFSEAEEGSSVILAFTNHDFRNMKPDIEIMRKMLSEAQKRYSNTQFKYCEARL